MNKPNRIGSLVLLVGMLLSTQAFPFGISLGGLPFLDRLAKITEDITENDFRGDDTVPIGFVFDLSQYNKLHAARAQKMAAFALNQVEYNACSIYSANSINMLTGAGPYTPLARPENYQKIDDSRTRKSIDIATIPYKNILGSAPEKRTLIDSSADYAQQLEEIAAQLDDGKPVIVGLDSQVLLRQYGYVTPAKVKVEPHVALLLGVQRDASGSPDGFFIMDSAVGMAYYLDRATLTKSFDSLASIQSRPFYLVSSKRFSTPFSEQVSRIRFIDITVPWTSDTDGMKVCLTKENAGINSWILDSDTLEGARGKRTSFLSLPLNQDGVYMESAGGTMSRRTAPTCSNITLEAYPISPTFLDKNKLAINNFKELKYDSDHCRRLEVLEPKQAWVFTAPDRSQATAPKRFLNPVQCSPQPGNVASGQGVPGRQLDRPRYCDVQSYDRINKSGESAVASEIDKSNPKSPLRGVACILAQKGKYFSKEHEYFKELSHKPEFQDYRSYLLKFRNQRFDASLPKEKWAPLGFARLTEMLHSSSNNNLKAYSGDEIRDFTQEWFIDFLIKHPAFQAYDTYFLAGYALLHIYFNDSHHTQNKRWGSERLYGADADLAIYMLEVSANDNKTPHAANLLQEIGIPRR